MEIALRGCSLASLISRRESRRALAAVASLLLFCAVGEATAQKAHSKAQNEAQELAKKIQEMTGGGPTTNQKLPPTDPCKLLTLAEIQKVFPQAKSFERNRRLEQSSAITECAWNAADGMLLMTVQQMYSSDPAKSDVETFTMGITDPTKPNARRNVRLETLAGVGDDAAAFVEREDKKRDILSDAAFLAVRKGPSTVWIASQELVRRDRDAALKALEQLGRAAASRL